jgi:hypothetical protein
MVASNAAGEFLTSIWAATPFPFPIPGFQQFGEKECGKQ